jgi:hypothetical protein
MTKSTKKKTAKKAPAKKTPAKKSSAKKKAPAKKASSPKKASPSVSDAAKSLIDQQAVNNVIDELIDSVPAQVTLNTSNAKGWIRKFFKNSNK